MASPRGPGLSAAQARSPAIQRSHAPKLTPASGSSRRQLGGDELLARYPDRTDRLYASLSASRASASSAARRGLAQAATRQRRSNAPGCARRAAEGSVPRPFANLTDDAARRYGLDPVLLMHPPRRIAVRRIREQPGERHGRLALMTPVHVDEASHALHTSALTSSSELAIEHQAWLLADRMRRFDARPDAALSAIATTDVSSTAGWCATVQATRCTELTTSKACERICASTLGTR